MMLREAKLVRYPFGNYWWQEVNPHEYQIRRADPTQTIIGRLVEVPAHGRDKGKWVLPDANQEYPVSETAVMGLELWHKWDVATAPAAPVSAPASELEPPAPSEPPAPAEASTEWLTVKEFAAQTGLSTSTVAGRIACGYLLAKKIPVQVGAGIRHERRLAPPAMQNTAYCALRLPPTKRQPVPDRPAPTPSPPPVGDLTPDVTGLLGVREAAPLYGVSRAKLQQMITDGKVPGVRRVPFGNQAGYRYLVPPPALPEPEPEPPPAPVAPQATGEGTDPDWYRQFIDLRNAHQTDMRDLARDLGRLLTRLETVEYELAQLRHAPAPVPHTAPSFWQRLTGTPSNGQSEAQP